jgi:hypothetical protein
MLTDVVGVVGDREVLVAAVAGHQAKLPVVEIHGAVVGDRAHEAAGHGADRLHGLKVLGEDVLLGERHTELRELQALLRHWQEPVALLREQRLAEASRY